MQPGRRGHQSGHSLVELMVAVILVMILAALAIPNAATTIANIKLRGTVSDFAGLVQKARIAAVQKNTTYMVLFSSTTGNAAYVDLNGNGSLDAGEPSIQLGGNVNNVAAPGGTSGMPTNLDASGGPLGWTATSGNISFNSRGLPCSTSTTPCSTNVNYIYYFEDTRALGGHGWAAVSITAAARVKVWWWNGSTWIN